MEDKQLWDELTHYWVVYGEENPGRAFEMLLMRHRWHHGVYVMAGLNSIGEELMARGKAGTKSTPVTATDKWTQFCNIPVGADDEGQIEALAHESGEVYRLFSELVLCGYRVSFAWNHQSQAVICSVTCREENDVNNGLTYTAFAGDWYTALTVAMYKHYEVTKGNWRLSAMPDARPRFG